MCLYGSMIYNPFWYISSNGMINGISGSSSLRESSHCLSYIELIYTPKQCKAFYFSTSSLASAVSLLFMITTLTGMRLYLIVISGPMQFLMAQSLWLLSQGGSSLTHIALSRGQRQHTLLLFSVGCTPLSNQSHEMRQVPQLECRNSLSFQGLICWGAADQSCSYFDHLASPPRTHLKNLRN